MYNHIVGLKPTQSKQGLCVTVDGHETHALIYPAGRTYKHFLLACDDAIQGVAHTLEGTWAKSSRATPAASALWWSQNEDDPLACEGYEVRELDVEAIELKVA